MVEEWVSWATQRPGPAEKVFAQANSRQGIVLHSAEGWLAGAFGELDKPERQASWHFTLALDGTLYQHYPLTASCWASGNFEANTRYCAMESEGVAGTPLNDAQVATARRLLTGLGYVERGVNIWEHNEVATRWEPNSGGTACPSGRYSTLYAAMEGDEMSAEDKALLDQLVTAVFGSRARLNDLLAGGYNPVEKRLYNLEANKDLNAVLAEYRTREEK